MGRTIKEFVSELLRPRFYWDRKTAHDMILVGIAKIVESIMSMRKGFRVDYSVTMWALESPYMISDRKLAAYERPPLRYFFRDMFAVGVKQDLYYSKDPNWIRNQRNYMVARFITGVIHVISFGTTDIELDTSVVLMSDD